jgi:two-component system OmpR family response regulator/two-component system response regulator QseB
VRILVVEDNSLVGTGLRSALTAAGFDVVWVKDGEAAFSTLAKETFLAMVLDLGLPGVGGLDMLRTLRSRGNKIPVLVLTARDATLDKVTGFNHGADDYLSKTTDIEELIVRLRALIRRSDRGDRYVAGDLVLNMDSGKVTQKGAPIDLSKREFDVLRILMHDARSIVTRNQLQQALYGNDRPMESNAIDVHIHNLRAKLGPKTLKTIRGVGYTIGL